MKSRITEAKFTKRKNIGNYEHEELTLAIAVHEDDDSDLAVKELMATVNNLLDGASTSTQLDKAVKADAPAPKEEKKEEPVKKTPAAKSKGKASAKTKKAVKEEVSKEEVEESFKGKAPKATIKYDRETPEHRQDLGGLLHTIAPDWRKDPKLKPIAAKLSRETLIGLPFKDANGTIVPSFVKTIKEALGVEESDDL